MLNKILRGKVLDYLKRRGVSMIAACAVCFLLGVAVGVMIAHKSRD